VLIDKTRGQVEAQISEAIIKFEKEYMGRGHMETKTYIIQVKSLHTDISTKTGERIIIFTLDQNLEDKFQSTRKID